MLGFNTGQADKIYTVFCWLECLYKMNYIRDYSVHLCIKKSLQRTLIKIIVLRVIIEL